MKSLKEIVTQMRDCGYTCEAGPLENNEDFRTLAKLAGVELPKTLGECLAEASRSAINLGLSMAEAFEAVGKLSVRTPQDMRDEIIEKAKHDVSELERHMHSIGTPPFKGNIIFNEIRTRVKFFINREKRAVTALIYDFDGYDLLTRGIAKCDPSDCFNVHIGKAIALRRALGLEVPAEYLNAPQPTEVRVGDILDWGSKKYEIKAIEYEQYLFVNLADGWESELLTYKKEILLDKLSDDSREEVAE
jgi:hypothetical protein